MENVVYVLGAGFSAELGIPVVANFLEVARDLYRLEPGKFEHFRPVLERLRQLGNVKTFMRFDLDNVEEVLSLLQMESDATGSRERSQFARFICDVVQARTPPLAQMPSGDDVRVAFDAIRPWRTYLWFVASLVGVGIGYPTRGGAPRRLPARAPSDARYTIVTLNYDRAIERAYDTLMAIPIEGEEATPPRLPPLLKLHGCVSNGEIIAPTANKGISAEVQPAWDAAFRALRDATHIRLIGYSLPETDVYVRYLFGAALSQALNPKRIDVLCLDKQTQVKPRFEARFEPRRLRFAGNIETGAYLSAMGGENTTPQVVEPDNGNRSRRIWFRPESVEKAHARVFASY